MRHLPGSFGATFVKTGQAVETGPAFEGNGLETPPPFGSLVSLNP